MSNNTEKLLESFDGMLYSFEDFVSTIPYDDTVLEYTQDYDSYTEQDLSNIKGCIGDCKQLLDGMDKASEMIRGFVQFFEYENNRR